MLKRLWMIFGPVLIAGLLVFLLIFFYPTEMHHNLGAEKRSAVATTIDSFKERSQKVRALSDPNVRFVPFFGSSEWLRFDGAHPAVLAEKYNRSYRPYLLGQGELHRLTNILECNRCYHSWRINKLCMLSHLSGSVKMAMIQQPSSSILMEIS